MKTRPQNTEMTLTFSTTPTDQKNKPNKQTKKTVSAPGHRPATLGGELRGGFKGRFSAQPRWVSLFGRQPAAKASAARVTPG